MDVGERTIRDFGEQWSRYRTNEGFYVSLEWFKDLCGPLLSVPELQGTQVAEIGSGAGRVVHVLLDAGVATVVAIEPSSAMEVLKSNTRERAAQIEYLQASGEEIPRDRNFDYVFSIGVLHHIPRPSAVVRAAFEALRPGGRMLIWVYGKEGNEAYLGVVQRVRIITTKLPPWILAGISHVLNILVGIYMFLCRYFPLPLKSYLLNVFGKFSRNKRLLAIYDQLNPAYAKYYTESEARALLEDAGFERVRIHHRHGYSWTVIGEKPAG